MDIQIGSNVKLTKSIYDDGEDHHMPGWIAYIDEIVVVKNILRNRLAVAHEGNTGSFVIYDGEYIVCE